jgi:hypothetical protein
VWNIYLGYTCIFKDTTMPELSESQWNRIKDGLLGQEQKTASKQSLGRGCGGFSTKIPAVCDTLGNPVRFILREGQWLRLYRSPPLA